MKKTKDESVEKKQLSKKELKKQEKLAKKQARDLERYGIEPQINKTYSTKTNWKALGKCFKYFTPYKGLIVIVVLMSLIYAGFSIVQAMLTENAINSVTSSLFLTAVYFGLALVVVNVLKHLVIYFWDFCSTKIGNHVTKDLRLNIMSSTFATKTSKFDNVNSGEIISRINSDSYAISEIVIVIVNNAAEILTDIAFVIYFFLVNVWIGVGVVITIIVFTLVDTLSQKYNYSLRKKERILNDKNIGLVSEIVRAIRDIKALNIKRNVNKKYEKNIDCMLNVSNDRAKYGYLLGHLPWVVFNVLEGGLFILGIYLIASSNIVLGSFMVFWIYKERALALMRYINDIRTSLKSTSISAERIAEILDDNEYPKERFGKKRIKNPKGKIEFKNVYFSYNDKINVLENFNLTIPANKTVAFVGKSGHGKSTLINLIPKLYEIKSGQIMIDGVDITNLSENGLRDLVTIVPQTPYIFNTTIRENLALVKPNMTDEEMIKACKIAQIHDFIISKEKGYDSVVGENGVILSGGQKQRLAIARALLKNSKIILLDEATSALDNESQEKIKNALRKLNGAHTIVIVAHRLSTVVDADEIVVIERGKIVGQGKHKDLMLTSPAYKKLYNTAKKSDKN